MHALINAASAHMGGALTYLTNILRCLPEVAPTDKFTVFAPEATRARLSSLAQKNIVLRDYPAEQTRGWRRLWFDQVLIPKIARQLNIDVLFSSTGFGTFVAPCPEILLVRNPVYFSEDFAQTYRLLNRSLHRVRLRRWYSGLSVKFSDHVLFPTCAMKDMVESHVDLSNPFTDVIHYGFDRRNFFKEGAKPPGIVQKIRGWKREGYQILLNVSTYAVHKNFETLIEGLAHLKANNKRFRLITTTSRERTSDKAEYDALQRRAGQLGVDENWVESGYVPYEKLQFLYRDADAYVFPSFTESFGHSLVEAMVSGLPVIAAGMPVNREFCSYAWCYFDTFDAKDCGQAIARVLAHADLRDEMRRASKRRAQDFSWQVYAEQLMAVFRRLAPAETDSPVTS